MKFFLILFLFSTQVYAQICEENGQLGALSSLAGKNCFNDDVSKDDINYLAVQKEEIAKICKNCESLAYSKLLENDEAVEEKESSYGKAILGEVQKELSLISMDLMKMRSSFAMSLSPTASIKSCNFKTQLKKPSCLTKEQEKRYRSQVLEIQNSLATELYGIISNKTTGDDGLFSKKSNSCNADDKTAMFAKTRFLESLITKDFLISIQSLNLSSKEQLSEEDKKKLTTEASQNFEKLKDHPLFSILIAHPSKLKQFINESLKPSTHQSISNDSIVEKLYEVTSQDFADDIKNRCQSIFSKATLHLENNFCNQKKTYLAEELESLETVSGTTFLRMKKEVAEKELQMHCALINVKKENSVSFIDVKNDLHNKNTDDIFKAPISDFKASAYQRLFFDSAENICAGMNKEPACDEKSIDQQCILLKFYNEAKSNKNYKAMAETSDENINSILRSLVGDGLPQKDGKVDQSAVIVLQNEGILAGGKPQTASKKPSASEFHRTVRSGGNSGTNLPNQQKMAQINPTNVNPTSAPSNQPTPNYNNVAPSDFSEDRVSPTNIVKKQTKPSSGTFSNLSEQEQNDLLNRLKRSMPKKKHQEDDFEDDGNFVGENTPSNLPTGTFSATADGVHNTDNTRVANPKVNGNYAGRKAVLDPLKKENSVNSALINANANRSPASSGVGSAPVVSISKPSKNENEIKIQVDEKELTQVKEFKEKLKKLLAAHGQEISVFQVGEKIVVKLNDYKIDVVYVPEEGIYKAIPEDKNVPKDYLNTISYYFNVTLKKEGGTGKREALLNTFQNSKK